MKGYNISPGLTIQLLLLLSNFAYQIRSDGIWSGDGDPFTLWYSRDEYDEGSPFESNLITTIKDLVHNTPQTGFNSTSYGSSPNKAYALIQCRGDASPKQCRKCAKQITKYAIAGPNHEVCGYSVQCLLWGELCFLRYSNYSFFSVLEPLESIAVFSPVSLSSKSPTVFQTLLGKLLANLSTVASLEGNNGFAAGSAYYSIPAQQELDAFVMCSRDLSARSCGACLSRLSEGLNSSGYVQGQAYDKSCTLRFRSTEADQADKSAAENAPMWWGLIGSVLLSIFGFMCS